MNPYDEINTERHAWGWQYFYRIYFGNGIFLPPGNRPVSLALPASNPRAREANGYIFCLLCGTTLACNVILKKNFNFMLGMAETCISSSCIISYVNRRTVYIKDQCCHAALIYSGLFAMCTSPCLLIITRVKIESMSLPDGHLCQQVCLLLAGQVQKPFVAFYFFEKIQTWCYFAWKLIFLTYCVLLRFTFFRQEEL